jgi:serine-type D-Ala-D-Ala carboxypeptidase/endopeptidase
MNTARAAWKVSTRSLVLTCFLFCAPTYAQQAHQRDEGGSTQWSIPSSAEIRKLLAERMEHNGVGIVVGIIEPGGRRIIAHGKTGARDDRPLNGDTVFQIGSVSKVFVGLLLADMVQRGEVGIDDPAAKYLPSGVKMPERGRPITLIDLSKHWSALPAMPTNFTLDARPNPYQAYSVDQLYSFLSTYELPREPGKQQYSNLGVALLGRLLARRAGVEYEELLKQRVLAPLGLNSTSITLNADQTRRLAPGHDRYLQPVDTWELLAMPASGSLRSTANDLLSFLAFNLGEQHSDLDAAMLYQRTPKRVLGWGASTLGGETVYGHEGGKAGYRAAAIFNPRTKTGVVVLANACTDDRPIDLARHLLFAGSPLLPAPAAPIRPQIVAIKGKTLDGYAGSYRLESGNTVRIARKRDHLLVNQVGGGISTFFPSGSSEFFDNTENARIVFDLEDGRATGLTLHEGDKALRATRVSSR